MQEIIDSLDETVLKKVVAATADSCSCSICQEMMYVPFMLRCGHSFCYGCLKEWFRNRVQCPLCRSDIRQLPVMNMSLREINNAILLALSSETMKRNRKNALEEFEGDAENQKLFNGVFKDMLETVLDTSDGVPRCSRCHWEVHGTRCLNCGAHFIDEEEAEGDDGEELYDEFDMDDDDEDGDDVDEEQQLAMLEAQEEEDGSSFIDDDTVMSAASSDAGDDVLSHDSGSSQAHEDGEQHESQRRRRRSPWYSNSSGDGDSSHEDGDEDDYQVDQIDHEFEDHVNQIFANLQASRRSTEEDRIGSRRRTTRIIDSDDDDDDE